MKWETIPPDEQHLDRIERFARLSLDARTAGDEKLGEALAEAVAELVYQPMMGTPDEGAA